MFLSHAGRRAEAGFAGSGGRFGSVQEGPGSVCRPEARSSVPSGVQNQHWARGAAALQGLLLQGTTSQFNVVSFAKCPPLQLPSN